MPAKKNQTHAGSPLRDRARGVHHHEGDERQPDDRQDRRDPVAAVEDVHRVLVFAAADEEHRDDRGQQAEGADDEREEDPGLGIRPAGALGDGEDGDAQDHGADVLGGGRLEQVGAAAGAVADVVADEVGDHGGVARVVLGDARLDLADQVGADVGGLGVDPAAELGEEGDEARAEAEADDEERRLLDRHVADERLVDGEDAPDAEQRERHHQEAGDGAAAHGDLDGADEAVRAAAAVRTFDAHADEHADDPRRHRARRADQEGDAGHDPDRQAGEGRHIRDLRGLDDADDDADEHRADQGQQRDGGVLAPDEGVRALADRVADGRPSPACRCRATSRHGRGRGRRGRPRYRRPGSPR